MGGKVYENGVFSTSLPPLDIFPTPIRRKLTNQYWKSMKYSDLSYSDSLGIKELRKKTANYLKTYRNMECDPDQIVVTSGSLHSMPLIAMAILNPKYGVILVIPTTQFKTNGNYSVSIIAFKFVSC